MDQIPFHIKICGLGVTLGCHGPLALQKPSMVE